MRPSPRPPGACGWSGAGRSSCRSSEDRCRWPASYEDSFQLFARERVAEAQLLAQAREHVVELAHPGRQFAFGFVGAEDLHDAALGDDDAEVAQQRDPRVVGDEDEDLALLPQQFQTCLLYTSDAADEE